MQVLPTSTISTRPASPAWISRKQGIQQRRSQSRRTKRNAKLQAVGSDSRQDLSQQLFAEVEKVPEKERSGPPVDAIKDILEQLRQVAEEHGFTKAEPKSSIHGKFKQLVNTTDFVDESRSVPLGALTFQQIGPKDLKMNMVPSSGYGGLYQGVDSANQYAIATPFKVAEGEHEGLLGISSVVGSYSIDQETPYRQNISFESLKVEPADTSSEGLSAWFAVFKESNPTIKDDGAIVINFPQAINGHRDFIYLDENRQVTVGNRGSIVVVERA